MKKETKPFIKVIIKPNKKPESDQSSTQPVVARENKPKRCKIKLPKRWVRL